MRRQISTWVRLLFVCTLLASSGCAITPLQLQDFAISTVIQVIASVIVNSLVAASTGT